MNDVRQFILTARSSKKKGKKGNGDSAKRSRFLSLVMPQLAGDNGKALAEAIEAKNLEKFKSLWGNATSAIVAKLEKQFKEGNDSTK